MKKIAVVLAVVLALAVVFVSCGGSNLKGTVWVGEKRINMRMTMGFSKPEMLFQRIEFDQKENKVTMMTAPEKYLVKDREYTLENGKDLIIYREDKKKVLEFKKKDPTEYEALIFKGKVDKDTITVGKVELKKVSRTEADKMLNELTAEYNEKLAAYEAEVDAYESKFK
jgi:hypothetical protein